jgi:hypothetical protein
MYLSPPVSLTCNRGVNLLGRPNGYLGHRLHPGLIMDMSTVMASFHCPNILLYVLRYQSCAHCY